MQKGWDWNHWWGITAVTLPVEQLRARIINADVHSGFEEMLYSDEAFAGSVSLERKNGIYAMKLHEHDKYNGSLRARKSYFFFDNRIVCIGTNVQSKIQDYPTETTLFQEFIPDSGAAIKVNGKSIVDFPYDWKGSGNNWIVDAQNNAYFIRNGDVFIRRSHQHSYDQSTAEPTENNFTVAAISHGNAPVDGSYEYAIVIKPKVDEEAKWAKNLSYKKNTFYSVVRQDSQAHIVRDLITNTTGYVLFETGEVSRKGLVLFNNIPCLIMVEEKDKKNITMSLVDPDLRFYEGPADEVYDENGKRVERSVYSRPWARNESGISHPQITLSGNWTLATPSEYCKVISSDKSKTVLEFTCQHGLSREVSLRRQ
jgi:chondroitin-sulfate-ABC endolyase/exolyase